MIKMFYSTNNMNSKLNDQEISQGSMLFYQSGSPDEYFLSSLKITSEINKYSTLEFTAPYNSEFYSLFEAYKFSKNIYVYKDDILIWKGFILDIEYDINRNMTVTCVDTFFVILNGVIDVNTARRVEDTGEIYANMMLNDFLTQLFDSFIEEQFGSSNNTQLGKFILENRTGTGGLIELVFQDDTPKQYLGDVLEEQILKSIGGYFFIDYVGFDNVLRYKTGEELSTNSSQSIELGSNIIDLKLKVKRSSTYSGIIGISNKGAIIKKAYRTFPNNIYFYEIKNFNDAVEYGETHELNTLVNDYYKKNIENKIPSTEIEVKALDLSFTNSRINPIKVGELIRISSPNHGIDDKYLCTKSVVDYLSPENSEYYFGGSGDNMSDLPNNYKIKNDSTTIYARNSIVSLDKRVTKLGG